MRDMRPRRTGKPPAALSLTGMLVAWRADGQPLLLRMVGSEALHLLCFSSKEHLSAFLTRLCVAWDRIKQIEDGRDFLSSIPEEIEVDANPWFTTEGRVRYVRVLRPHGE